jgi:hypothetical protein
MHVYAHLFDEGDVGQLLRAPLRSVTRLSPVPTLTRPMVRYPQFFQPARPLLPTVVPACFGQINWSTDHSHNIIYTGPVPPIGGTGSIAIPRSDVDTSVAKNYTTSINNDHTHTLYLSAADFAALRAGKTVTKETSRDARRGGRAHTHTVRLSCGGLQDQIISGSVPY